MAPERCVPMYDYFVKELPADLRSRREMLGGSAVGALPVVTSYRDACRAMSALERTLDRSPSAIYMPVQERASRKGLLITLHLLLSEYFPAPECTIESMLTLLDMADSTFGCGTSPLELLLNQVEHGERYEDLGNGQFAWARTELRRNSDGACPGALVNERRGFGPEEDAVVCAFDVFRHSCPRDTWSQLAFTIRLTFRTLAQECGASRQDADDANGLLFRAAAAVSSGEFDALDQLMVSSLLACVSSEPKANDVTRRYLALLGTLV